MRDPMPSFPTFARGLPGRVLLTCLLLLAAVAAQAMPPVVLDARTGSALLWPAVTVLRDPTHQLELADVRTRDASFARPTGPYANLGLERATVWLRVPVLLSSDHPGDFRWMFTIDYASLDAVDLYVQQGDRTLQHAVMGDRLLVHERPFPGRTHSVALDLPPGEPVTLYVRVRTTSTVVVPMVIRTATDHVAHENAFQLWHGIAVGIGLCALIYALTGFVTTREALYGWLAWSVVAGVLYFFAYFGFAQQYVWPDSPWLVQNGAAFLMLLVLAGGFMFAERSLDVSGMYPRVGRAMHVLAGLLVVLAGLFAAGHLGYHQATDIATVVGSWPMLLSVTVAVKRARKGDRAATWVIIGWLVYAVGVVAAMAVNRGHGPAAVWMQEAHMVAALLQAFAWIMVINVRVAEIRDAAEATRREHDRMMVLSQTDALTGLLNRRGLQLGLQPLIDQAAPGRLTAVYLLDLDGFKPVNDQHGHDAGDELLVQIGQRLKAVVRANDLVARLGGDEFVVVASQLGGDTEAELVGHKLLGCCDAPFRLTHAECEVGMTVGYAIAAHAGAEGAELLRRADSAMYGGKQAGKRRVRRAHVETGPQ